MNFTSVRFGLTPAKWILGKLFSLDYVGNRSIPGKGLESLPL